jgi:hypothetical protein
MIGINQLRLPATHAGGVAPGMDDGARVLGTSLLIFLLAGVVFLFALRYLMLKRGMPASAK